MCYDLNLMLPEIIRGHARENCRVAEKKLEWHQL